MLKDLTLEMCVPILRCKEAHRMHKKMPKFQLAHPGLRAPQSAHWPLPGARNSSCSSRSLRACCRLLIEAMMAQLRGRSDGERCQGRIRHDSSRSKNESVLHVHRRNKDNSQERSCQSASSPEFRRRETVRGSCFR